MLPLNLPFKLIYSLIVFCFLLIGCGDHNKPESVTSTSTPIINLTSGPYTVVVNKDLIVGVETKFAANEPIYSAIPSPVGIAIVNQILPGQIFITGIKAGTTTFTISDLANPTAVPRTLSLTVNDAPTLKVSPDPISGRVGQSLLVDVTTLNPESTSVYSITIEDTSVGRIIDVVNNPTLIDLIKIGTTNITIKDQPNGLSEVYTLTVTP